MSIEMLCELWKKHLVGKGGPLRKECSPVGYFKPFNCPLTLDELRKMGGQPVWIERNDGGESMWVIVGYSGSPYGVYFGTASGGMCLYYDDYGDTWLAFYHKPKKGESK